MEPKGCCIHIEGEVLNQNNPQSRPMCPTGSHERGRTVVASKSMAVFATMRITFDLCRLACGLARHMIHVPYQYVNTNPT